MNKLKIFFKILKEDVKTNNQSTRPFTMLARSSVSLIPGNGTNMSKNNPPIDCRQSSISESCTVNNFYLILVSKYVLKSMH